MLPNAKAGTLLRLYMLVSLAAIHAWLIHRPAPQTSPTTGPRKTASQARSQASHPPPARTTKPPPPPERSSRYQARPGCLRLAAACSTASCERTCCKAETPGPWPAAGAQGKPGRPNLCAAGVRGRREQRLNPAAGRPRARGQQLGASGAPTSDLDMDLL
jgi:hypothetical protein